MYHSSDSDVSVSEENHEFAALRSWKWELGQSINAVQSFGDVAWSDQYQHIVLPGLEVGGTPIPLPLATSRDADVIRKASRLAPFGRGNKTVVDESVRKTWEIGCEGFKLLNPQWPSFVEAILEDASVPLSLPPGVRAEQYKLLLYEPGSFFKPHKDSEKAPGMIATLVICLPSAHQGGEVHIAHNEQKHVLTTSQASAFDITALVWYSDVSHEVMETTSGNRLVLTYNIILDKNQSSRPSAGGFNRKQAALETSLNYGHIHHPEATRLLYPLSHQYSPTGLSMHNMKGIDRARVYALRKACVSSGYLLLLANTSKTTWGVDEDRYGEPDDDIFQLTYIATCDGAQVGGGINFDPDFIGQNPYSDDRYADSEVEEEHLGNEEAAPEFRYHDSAAILVRQDDLLDFLPVEFLFNDTVAYELAKLISESPCTRTSAAELLKELVKPPKRKMGKTLSEILSFAIATGDRNLWDEVFDVATIDFGRIDPRFGRYRADFHLFGGSDIGRNEPTTNTWKMGCLTPVLSKFASHLNEGSMGRLEGGWDEHLGKMVLNLHTLENVEKALDSLAKSLKRSDIKQSLRTWRISVAETRFNQPNSPLKWNDSSTIMSLLQREKGLDWVNNSLLPALENRADKSLLLTLLPTLLDHAETPDMKTIAKKIYWGTMSQLKVDASNFGPAVVYPYSTWNRKPKWLASTRDLEYKDSQVSRFMILANRLALHGFGEEAALLINNCCSSVAEAHEGPVRVKPKPPSYGDKHVSSDPHLLVEYFLTDVLSVVEHSGRPAPASLKCFFERVVRHYILSELPPWPKKLAGWAHRTRNCNADTTHQVDSPKKCKKSGACKELNEFLQSETEQSHTFSLAGRSYNHFRFGLLPEKHFRLETVGEASYYNSSPKTLVVTKLGTEYQEDVEMHKTEIHKLEKRFLAFRTPFVKALLGDELYAELILLGDIRKPPGDDSGTLVPLSYTEPNADPSGKAQETGTKRPASGDIEQPAASRVRRGGAT